MPKFTPGTWLRLHHKGEYYPVWFVGYSQRGGAVIERTPGLYITVKAYRLQPSP